MGGVQAEILRALVLVGVGVAGGLCATIAGLASLVSYPALLALGLPPVTANVTNTVALVATGLGAVTGSRRELAGQRRRLLRFGLAACVGGSLGALLLLVGPAGSFEAVVPFLVAGACVVVLVQPAVQRRVRRRRLDVDDAPAREPADRIGVLAAVAAVAVYGGYFGAASGVLTLALMSGVLPESLPRVNAVKNALGLAANGVAAVGFAAFGPVDWGAAIPLMVGFFAGGRVGPIVVRHLPAGLLRVVIAVAGLGLAVRLWVAR